MVNNLKLEYSKCKKLISEADLLLFKKHRHLNSMGWWIAKYTNSDYSHAALAHWHAGEVRCLEFKEFCGCRESQTIVDYLNDGYLVDVFRAYPMVKVPYIDVTDQNHPVSKTFTHHFTKQTAKDIIETAHKFIGTSYSWWTIWQMAKTFIPFVRLYHKVRKTEKIDPKNFVCSTLVSYSYRLNYIDPVEFLSDSYTTPGDLARSNLFVKLFEIC